MTLNDTLPPLTALIIAISNIASDLCSRVHAALTFCRVFGNLRPRS